MRSRDGYPGSRNGNSAGGASVGAWRQTQQITAGTEQIWRRSRFIGGTGYVGSAIAREALAFVDEIERARHHRERFTVAY